MKTIYLVIPCYNEEEVLLETAKRLKEKINILIEKGKISEKSRVTFVDDGSKDNTWSIIEHLNSSNNIFSGIKLSRNRGHQNALLAGLMTVKNYCDAAISLDADLQDDINVIDKFIDKFIEGCDVVYGVRSDRKTDTIFKRTTAQGFYKVMKVLGVDIVYNHADYRLMSKRALESLEQFKEVNLFLRGIVPLIGYKSDVVLYERNERFAGESKYPLKKMLSFAFEGITSFSVKPIRLILTVGIVMFISSLVALLYFLIIWIMGKTVQGWTTVVASIWMLGGIQLLCLGIIGEYIGKIYMESKARPKFIIDKFINA
ncbi:glycosyltransferase family 2 protein [Clostridium saudiense]|uniref:glycosyltransferase family 2 protein n=1 Tax=Clostridium saudiense TaxID=1414720 RepID=UPI0018A92F09|nr:glycosyltransferase family 2 protein [Clostridium saudiense]